MKPTLYILCGYPFSGKTTLARAIIELRPDCKHISVDEIKTGISDQSNDGIWEQAFAEAYRRTRRFLLKGQSVIFDATNFLVKVRDKARTVAQASNADSRVIWVNTPQQEAKNRWLVNRQSKERKDVSDDDWLEVTGQFEIPGTRERTIEYCGEDIKDWIEANLE
ncbi:MAG: ATP-binding protein [Chloroflexi bacterium]|nr:ATP-binding protein [Chloroflexota bacterium]